jgi:hypothetical protein
MLELPFDPANFESFSFSYPLLGLTSSLIDRYLSPHHDRD